MSDSILNFSDMGSPEYTGLYDTSSGFSGSSTLQDVQLGSPVQLDTTYGVSPFSVTDSVNTPPFSTDAPFGAGAVLVAGQPNNVSALSLSGVSDTPFLSATSSTPSPAVSPGNAGSMAGLSALSKFGASIASLWSNPVTAHAGAQQTTTTTAGAVLPSGAVSGTNVLLLVIVVGALVLLLLRSE